MNPQIQLVNFNLIFPTEVNRKFGLRRSAPVKQSFYTALNSVNLSIHAGERVGLLGKNGAGKSTLLKALAGVYRPTSGSISIDGKVMSLFEASVGMDLELSGYDNIPLLMAVRGIPLKKLKEITTDVEEFTELGDSLHRKAKTFSAGMKLRLAFAVATYCSAQILLIDEVIGVGDASFREKSKERIEKLLFGAGTCVLASHSSAFLRAYCSRGLVFDGGAIVFDGDIEDAITYYADQ